MKNDTILTPCFHISPLLNTFWYFGMAKLLWFIITTHIFFTSHFINIYDKPALIIFSLGSFFPFFFWNQFFKICTMYILQIATDNFLLELF